MDCEVDFQHCQYRFGTCPAMDRYLGQASRGGRCNKDHLDMREFAASMCLMMLILMKPFDCSTVVPQFMRKHGQATPQSARNRRDALLRRRRTLPADAGISRNYARLVDVQSLPPSAQGHALRLLWDRAGGEGSHSVQRRIVSSAGGNCDGEVTIIPLVR